MQGILERLHIANIERQNEWDSGGKMSLTYKTTELAGEVGELCNEIKKLERERLGCVGSRTTEEKIRKELADVFICADLLAIELNLNVEELIKEKFNETSEKNGLKTKII